MGNRFALWSVGIVVSVLGIQGCADPTASLEELPARQADKTKAYLPSAFAGVNKDVSKSQSPDRLKGLVSSSARFGSRQNPFQLNPEELSFDKLQAAEKLLAEQGSFGSTFELPEDKEEQVVAEEAQPYRRISGIIIGDAVYAILEQNGRSYIIRPGSEIPDTNWRVASIDRDRVILRRSGNVQPNEIEVRLELPPPGMGTQGANPGGSGGPRDGGKGSAMANGGAA